MHVVIIESIYYFNYKYKHLFTLSVPILPFFPISTLAEHSFPSRKSMYHRKSNNPRSIVGSPKVWISFYGMVAFVFRRFHVLSPLSKLNRIDNRLLVKHTGSGGLDVVKVLVARGNGTLNIKGPGWSDGSSCCFRGSLDALGHNLVLNLLVHVICAQAAGVDDPTGSPLGGIHQIVSNRGVAVIAANDKLVLVHVIGVSVIGIHCSD